MTGQDDPGRRTVVIGAGNEFRRDDGAGPAVIARLRALQPSDPSLSGVTLALSDGDPGRLIDLWAGARLAVVIDAVRDPAMRPGHWRQLADAALTGLADGVASSHGIGIGNTVELARVLGRLPARLTVLAVAGRDFGFGIGLTAEVATAVGELAEQVREIIRLTPPGAGVTGHRDSSRRLADPADGSRSAGPPTRPRTDPARQGRKSRRRDHDRDAAKERSPWPAAMPRSRLVSGQREAIVMTGQERRIVVGVDGSGSSKAALRWAIRQAKLTGSSVEAVTAWHYPTAYGLPPGSEGTLDFEANAKSTLVEALAEVSGFEPDVPVRPLVTCGVTAEVLLHAAKGADLLVVGSRGYGAFASALLGSVSMYCVLHAHGPVLVLRDGHAGS
jgi:hydrogenase maturation protease